MCVRGICILWYVCRLSAMMAATHATHLTIQSYSFICLSCLHVMIHSCTLTLHRTLTVDNLDVSLGVLVYKVCTQ